MVRNIYFLVLAVLVIVLDQLSKWFVVEKLIKPLHDFDAGFDVVPFFEWLFQAGDRLAYQQIPVWPFFNIVMVWNKGMSFGLFNNASDYAPLVLGVVAGVITLVFLVWLLRTESLVQMVACALVIGGAVGNIVDRLRFGAVIDFLDVHVAGYHWPAFNVADSAVFVGIALIIFHSFFLEKTDNS